MTTSRQPWTTEVSQSGDTYIKDADGKLIGCFADHRDADLVLKAFSYKQELEDKDDQLQRTEEDLASEKSKYEKLSTIVQFAHTELGKADIV